MSVYLINEAAPTSILNEIKTIDGSKDTYKIRGNSVLQTINELNENRRVYTTAIAERFVETANQKIATGRMLGEQDHPEVNDLTDPKQLKRQLCVLWERVCCRYPKMWIEGNKICSIVETTSNARGIDMAKMANIDGIPIGFSCRAVGNVKKSPLAENAVEVVMPAIFITYDSVVTPSHSSAELKDITHVISNNNIFKLAESDNSNGNVAINESAELLSLRDLFLESNPMKNIIDNFLTGKFRRMSNLSESQKVNYGKRSMDMLLYDYLSSSDKNTGSSSYNNLNESNVRSLMDDYAYSHKDYNSSSIISDKIKKFLR